MTGKCVLLFPLTVIPKIPLLQPPVCSPRQIDPLPAAQADFLPIDIFNVRQIHDIGDPDPHKFRVHAKQLKNFRYGHAQLVDCPIRKAKALDLPLRLTVYNII